MSEINKFQSISDVTDGSYGRGIKRYTIRLAPGTTKEQIETPGYFNRLDLRNWKVGDLISVISDDRVLLYEIDGNDNPLRHLEITQIPNVDISGGDASTTVVTSTGSTTAQTLADRFTDTRMRTPYDFGAAGGGADDAVFLQAFFNAGGGLLPDDTFASGTTLTIPATGVTIIGNKGKSWIKRHSSLADGSPLIQMADMGAPGVDEYDNANVHLLGVGIDGEDAALTSHIALVRLWNLSGLSVHNCILKDHRYILLSLGGVNDFEISGTEFTGWGRPDVSAEGGAALWIGNEGAQTNTCRNGLVTRCWFHDGEWSALYHFATGVDFTHNTVERTKEGIYYRRVDAPTNSKQSVFAFNKIDDVEVKFIQGAGIEIAADRVFVAFNDIKNCEGAGIDVADPTVDVSIIHNNVSETVTDTATFPLYGQITVRQTAVTGEEPRDVRVQFNRVGSEAAAVAPRGIAIRDLESGNSIDRIVVSDNNLTNAAASSANNLVVEGPAYGVDWQIARNIGDETFRKPTEPSSIVDEFTSSGTWTKREGAVKVVVEMIGPGGGGGGGARVASGTAASGGGGGGGGGRVRHEFDASDLASTVTVTIGTAGAAGAGATVDNTDGVSGTQAGDCTFGAHLTAYGGGGGSRGVVGGPAGAGGGAGAFGRGGTGSGASAGTAGTGGGVAGGAAVNTAMIGGAGGGQGNSGAAGSASNGGQGGGGGGGAGGGLASSPADTAGGNGGRVPGIYTAPAGGSSAVGTAGTNPTTSVAGAGGGGGGSNASGAGYAGGAGGFGAGGGGGGAGLSANGAIGGAGGGGFVRVTTYF